MKLQTMPDQQTSISHYDENSLTINRQKYNQTILITSNKVSILNTLRKTISKLNNLTIKELPLETNIDLLIIGGHQITPLKMPYKFQQELASINISLEIMSLGAACRTFNILRSEDRDVACLIFM